MSSENIRTEAMSSFLAALLLTRKYISCSDLCSIMSDFEMKNDVYLVEKDMDDVTFVDNAQFDSNGNLYLIKDYNDIISDKSVMTVGEYLFQCTTEETRNYFNLCIHNSIKRN